MAEPVASANTPTQPTISVPTDSEPVTAAPATPNTSEPKSEELPSSKTLETIYALDVFDKDNKPVKFGSFVNDSTAKRNIVIFIRHFFCGLCQDYIRALAKTFPPEKLAVHSPSTNLIVIGCGDASRISAYVAETACPFPMYADPGRKLYTALDLKVTLARSAQKPEYISQSFLSGALDGIKQSLAAGLGSLKGGKISQNGGEMIWVDGECKFLHRMKDTTSHMEVKELQQVLDQIR